MFVHSDENFDDPLAREIFEHHLFSPRNRGHLADGAHSGVAGGAACGDLVRISVEIDGDRVSDAGFDASGCGAVQAAASAAVELVIGLPVLEAALIGVGRISEELGGLSPGKRHAADLVGDALAQALGSAAYRQAAVVADPQRTLVAMSGGVDSSVVALLCQRDGRNTAAVTVELWADEDNDAERSCCSASAVRAARAQAHRLGLPHFTLNLREQFRAGVVEPYLDGHAAGVTPNPCVRCNGDVRLDEMLALADRLGAADLATGHYARVQHDGEGPLLRLAADPAKDQTYMLAGLDPASLARLRFPLGGLTKPQVREIAAEARLSAARKPDSQDLCFLAGTSREAFLARHGGLTDRPGDIVDLDGHLLGSHRGVHHFTVGQRRGIGVAGREALYVLRLEPRERRVVVGTREQLALTRVPLAGVRLLRDGARVDRVKLRYKAEPLPARIVAPVGTGRHRRLEIQLLEAAYGVAPGQTACLMDGERVVGLGTISPG